MAIRFNTASATILATALTLSACATKDFGRIEAPRNLATMTCAELADQQVSLNDFRAQIDEKDDWDARTLVASTLLDFGYGNMRDKKKALASADQFEADVTAAQRARGCDVTA